MALKIITPPATEPISLEEMMNFSRIATDADVITMEAMITTARQEAEKITRRQLITATWELRLDRFPGGSQFGPRYIQAGPPNELIPGRGEADTIYLPMPPLQSVTTLKYLDSANVEQTLTENTDYLVDTYSEPARITPAYGEVWPTIYPVIHAVRIRFVAGYGANDTDVPESIRQWIKVCAGNLYENRELDIVSNTTQALTHMQFLDGLLDNYRVWEME